jgi:predicted RNase H-like HicB family nuclease
MEVYGMLSATEVRANFGQFIDDVVRIKPQIVKRNRDTIIAFSQAYLKDALSIYELTFEYEQDEDGIYAGSIEQIPDIVADGATLDELRNELAHHLIEYAKDYYDDFDRYYNASNRRSHANYMLRVLLEDEDIQSVASMLHA